VALKLFEMISILLSTLVAGVVWGPWLALSRSVATFPAEIFIPVAHRMIRNLEPFMTVLIPAAMLSIVPVVFLSYDQRPKTCILYLAGFASFVVGLFLSVLVQVPIVNKIRMWTVETLPDNWQQLRDRWKAVQVIRIVTSIVGLALLILGSII
jgi:hypothetical protein